VFEKCKKNGVSDENNKCKETLLDDAHYTLLGNVDGDVVRNRPLRPTTILSAATPLVIIARHNQPSDKKRQQVVRIIWTILPVLVPRTLQLILSFV
jgi:hypothetical protein